MGLGVDTDNPYGLVGVGYPAIEVIDPKFRTSTSIYLNLPQELVSDGIIPTVAYSLWLNDLGMLHSSKFLGWSTLCIEINFDVDDKTNSAEPLN